MDINTQLWQSISYTGTQANTHVKWLVAETSEHILHSASKTVKVALTSHYSFFLLLHLPLIPSLSVVSFPFPSWWLRWNFKQELWSLSMTVTRFFFFFFKTKRVMLSTYRLWEEKFHSAILYVPGLWLPLSLPVIAAYSLTTKTTVPYAAPQRLCQSL